ncbi:hypothetical protein F3Y22_tig00110383pilonHSYRG00242 [Hibiscus syriacus]|uniref:Uncharacterized protein n=1 Tax=Hibiscus syriacus TaxID=106335 RepID=A0A6A3AX26_HIBSY|nr:hypothetical protein F3Y22_tig00110383pilonHSYRG00242 [Hibiscus syriacus]
MPKTVNFSYKMKLAIQRFLFQNPLKRTSYLFLQCCVIKAIKFKTEDPVEICKNELKWSLLHLSRSNSSSCDSKRKKTANGTLRESLKPRRTRLLVEPVDSIEIRPTHPIKHCYDFEVSDRVDILVDDECWKVGIVMRKVDSDDYNVRWDCDENEVQCPFNILRQYHLEWKNGNRPFTSTG